jgi:hypothetical protein
MKSNDKLFIFSSKQDSDHNVYAFLNTDQYVKAVTAMPEEDGISKVLFKKIWYLTPAISLTVIIAIIPIYTYAQYCKAKFEIYLLLFLPRDLYQKLVIMSSKKSLTLF